MAGDGAHSAHMALHMQASGNTLAAAGELMPQEFLPGVTPVQAYSHSELYLAGNKDALGAPPLKSSILAKEVMEASDLPPDSPQRLSCSADAGDAAEALAALQGSSRGLAPPQAPGAPSPPAHIMPGLRVPGMGRGSSLYRGVSKVSLQ